MSFSFCSRLKCTLRAKNAVNASQYLYVDPKWIQVLCVWDIIAWRPVSTYVSCVATLKVRNVTDNFNNCWNTVL